MADGAAHARGENPGSSAPLPNIQSRPDTNRPPDGVALRYEITLVFPAVDATRCASGSDFPRIQVRRECLDIATDAIGNRRADIVKSLLPTHDELHSRP